MTSKARQGDFEMSTSMRDGWMEAKDGDGTKTNETKKSGCGREGENYAMQRDAENYAEGEDKCMR